MVEHSKSKYSTCPLESTYRFERVAGLHREAVLVLICVIFTFVSKVYYHLRC